MGKVTMRDVAERAGVSKATVSHVLNGTRFVEPETRARVEQMIAELRYRPNLLARGLRRHETLTIGLITPNIANPFWAEFASEVERAGLAAGYTVLLCNTNWSVEQERAYVQTLLARQIDGVVLVPATTSANAIGDLRAVGAATVVVGQQPQQHGVSAVMVDDFRGGYLAGEYLLSLGHRRIGCITPPPGIDSAEQRVAGLRQACADAGVVLPSTALVAGDFEYASGEQAVRILQERNCGLTAIFAANDQMAIGALRGLRKSGRSAPADLSVIGFDNISYAALHEPGLTTVSQPLAELGRQVVELLLRQINEPGSSPEVRKLTPTLVVRESCRALHQ
jgi:LacI family transcriptional regulator